MSVEGASGAGTGAVGAAPVVMDAAGEEDSGVVTNIKHTVLVLSGKGGVGKSTVAVQLALCLALLGKKVGLLDIDLCGPSVPRMLGIESSDVRQSDAGWVPARAAHNIKVMSIAFLLGSRDEAVVWRGPKKTSMIKQFIENVCWGTLDYLVVDTPPGTSDEHMAILETLGAARVDGAVLVTTPQEVAVADVRKEVDFCAKAKVRVLGVVENMSGFVCPCCNEPSNIFAAGGGEALAKQCGMPFLGRIPIEPRLAASAEGGAIFVEAFAESETAKSYTRIAEGIVAATAAPVQQP